MPTPSSSPRLLPLAGLAYPVLMVVAAVAFPAPPGGDVAAAERPAWLAAHTGAVLAQAYVRALAALAFVVLAVAVSAACRRASAAPSAAPVLALVGGACSGAFLLLAQGGAIGAALHVRDGGSADTVRALGALQNAFLDLSSLPAVLLFGSAGVVALRTGMLPRWLAWLTLAGVPLALADAASYDGGPLEVLGLPGLAYFLVWSLLAAVRLATDSDSREPGMLARFPG